jgi:hypothetical protein
MLVLCLSALALPALTANAQAQLSGAQQSALKSSCRSDFMSHCSGVAPGGKDALVCLQKNVASLSPACQSAVRATLPPPAAAAKPPTPTAAKPPTPMAAKSPATTAAAPTAAQQSALKSSCRSDFMSHCSGVTPGGKEALACLQKNAAQLSPACQQAVAAIQPAAAPTSLAPPVVTAPPPPPAKKPSVVSAAVMLRACKLDLMRHCHGVDVGGGRKLACLAAHRDNLTFRCRTALKVTAPLR